MPAFQSSKGAELHKLTTHAAQLRANIKKPTDGVITTFTKPGFAYAVLPLPASPKQIRDANHLMLQDGHCYLCLFAVRHRRQIAQCLGAYPTFSRVEQQLRKNPAFHHHDQFVTAYISAPFVAHIAKSKMENPLYLGTLRRLNEGLPIRVGVSASASASASAPEPPAIPGPEVDMIDMALVPYITKTGHREKKQAHQYVIKNHHTEHQIKLSEAAHQDIVRAKVAGMERQTTYILECHFNRLVRQFKEAYLAFRDAQKDGMKHLEINLLSLAHKANKFSVDL